MVTGKGSNEERGGAKRLVLAAERWEKGGEGGGGIILPGHFHQQKGTPKHKDGCQATEHRLGGVGERRQ